MSVRIETLAELKSIRFDKNETVFCVQNGREYYLELDGGSFTPDDIDFVQAIHGVNARYIAISGSTQRNFISKRAKISDVKAVSTPGGTLTAGAWQVRDLNTEDYDPSNIVSITSNRFKLQPGEYYISGKAPAYQVEQHQLRLYNYTAGTVAGLGPNAYTRQPYNVENSATVKARVVITVETEFELQHRSAATFATEGLGIGNNWGDCIYAEVEIEKVA